MNKTIHITARKYFLLLVLSAVTGCSAVDSSYRAPNQTTARSLPSIPEIKRPQRVKPRSVPSKKAVVRAPITSTVINPIPKKTVQVKKDPVLLEQQRLEEQQRIQQQAKQDATVDYDPFAGIPSSSSSKPTITSTVEQQSTPTVTSSTSPAVKSLMAAARADIALGRSRSAISKLERGLRIEPQNAQAWHMLAKAHYSNSAYLHSISIAKKSNALSNDDNLIAENWKLIKQAGERSGNASAVKEALDYIKLNP